MPSHPQRSLRSPGPRTVERAFIPDSLLDAVAGEVRAPAPPRPSPAVRAESAHLPALDGLRGLAILLVLGHHLFQGQSGRSGVLDPVVTLLGYGWCGVDLFFALSGFLITGILLRARGRPNYFRNFYARRTLRIFPLYFGCLAAVLVVLPALGVVLEKTPGAPADAWHWLYGTNLLIALRGSWDTGLVLFPFTHFWSLAVEEHFYLAWPILVAVTPARHLAAVCVGAIAGSALLRAGFYLATHDWIAAYVWTPFRIDALALGSLAAVVLARTPDRAVLRRRAVAALALSGGLLALAFAFTAWTRDGLFVPIAGYTLLAVFFAALVLTTVLAPATHPLVRICSAGLLRFFGRYSYGIYVFHVFAIAWIAAVRPRFDFAFGLNSLAAELLLSRAAILALTVGAAWLSWHVFEQRFVALKSRFA